MAEVLASLKKIGGNGEQYTETVLWTNPSPTAQFAGQAVTLSDSISNYKYIKITNNFSTAYPTIIGSTIFPVEDFKTAIYPVTGREWQPRIGMGDASTNYARRVYYVSETSIQITSANLVTSGQGGANNNNAIPFEILGLNELAHSNVADFATLSISQGSANPTGHGYTTNSSIFTVSYEDASSPRTGTITVNKTGTYVVSAAARNRGPCTPSIKKDGVVWVDNNQYYTSTVKGIRDEEIQITAGTVFLLDPTATTGATGYTSLVIAKK